MFSKLLCGYITKCFFSTLQVETYWEVIISKIISCLWFRRKFKDNANKSGFCFDWMLPAWINSSMLLRIFYKWNMLTFSVTLNTRVAHFLKIWENQREPTYNLLRGSSTSQNSIQIEFLFYLRYAPGGKCVEMHCMEIKLIFEIIFVVVFGISKTMKIFG